MKLSLAMICKDEKANLERLWPLVKDHIDEWVVVVPNDDPAIPFLKGKAEVIEGDFTQAIEPEIIEQMREWGLEVDPDYRIFNFAAARNASLAAATGDYVLWLDADDEPVGMDNIKKFLNKDSESDVFDAVYDYYRDEEGNSAADHIRERIVRNNGQWEWVGSKLGLIHETLLAIEPFVPLRRDFPDDVFRVVHHSDHVDASSMRNHVALLYEYLKTGGEDPRTVYYLGVEYFNRGMWDYCVKVLSEYVKVGGWDEERYHAYMKMGEAYHMLDDPESGRNMYLLALKELPNRPEAYFGLGESYHEEENWGKAIEFLLSGLHKKMPTGKYLIDRVRLTFRPAVYIALAYLQLGKPLEAYNWFAKAAKMNPKHPYIKEYAQLFLDARDLHDYVTSFVKLGQISQRLYPKTLYKLAEVIPDELKDQDLLMDFKWRYAKPTIWPSNSVVIFCSSAYDDWGPESLINGCGGSEEAVIQLSKRLATLGWDVTVYNNCAQEKTVDGVKWVRFERFNPRDIFNILVSWRNNMFLDPKVAKKKYIDLHDVPDPKHYALNDLKDVTLLVKSQYHRTTLAHLPDERFKVIPNGIDSTQFMDLSEKVVNNLVWTSSYDRGLQYLLEMWPDIRKAVPDATIDIYYGFDLFDVRLGRQGKAFKQMMLELFKQPGVTEHGRVGTDVVAAAYRKADIWAYPTDFPEIDCITATKAHAAKCVPIATDFAVMKERNQGVVIEGHIWDQDVKDKFKQELIALMQDEKRKTNIRTKLDVSSYDWDNIAQRWDEEFRS